MIPPSLADVSPSWLSTKLGVGVSAVDVEPMPGLVGILGEVGVITVDLEESSLPRRFVGKMPLQNEVAQMYNEAMCFYQREHGWYRDIARDSPLRAPQAYINDYDPATGEAFLLLEKVDATSVGNILEGASYERHCQVIDILAAQHASYWEAPALAKLDWLWDWSSTGYQQGGELMRSVWPIFHEAKPNAFPNELRDYLEGTFVDNLHEWLRFFAARPATLCHGDFQLDNILFDQNGPLVLDFQMNVRSFPGADLGWYLASSLPGDQRAYEADLIDRYRGALASAGGPELAHDDVLDELALFTMQMLTGQALANLQETDDYGEHGARMRLRLDAFLSGTVAAAERWETIERTRRLKEH